MKSKAVIIMTDGYAEFPPEEVSMDVPVLWMIFGDNIQDVPWGTTIHW